MADILSQDEIDILLDVLEDEASEAELNDEDATKKQVTLYDFKRPSILTKDQLQSFREDYTQVARKFAKSLSDRLKTIVKVQLHSVDQVTYGEFLLSLPNPTVMSFFSMQPLSMSGVFEMNPTITFPIVDKTLGGKANPYDPCREFSKVEEGLFGDVQNDFMKAIKEVYEPIVELYPLVQKLYLL